MTTLSLKEAQEAFYALLERVAPKDAPAFMQWIGDTVGFGDEREDRGGSMSMATRKLHEIAYHLRQKLPVTATLESEKILWPKIGYDSECNSTNTVHVDCFLYDDDAVQELVQEGKMSRSYCKSCGGKDTAPLTFISHSLSIPQLEFIMTSLVPLATKPEGFHVLDIGSRLGSVTAAAHLFSNGRAIVTGIELNEDFCKIQESVKEDFGLQSVSIIACDVRQQSKVVEEADLVVMNNVFCFFASPDEQADCWKFLHTHLRTGTLLVHNPRVDEVTAHLDLPFAINDWLLPIRTKGKAAKFAKGDEEVFEDCAMLSFYEVKGPAAK